MAGRAAQVEPPRSSVTACRLQMSPVRGAHASRVSVWASRPNHQEPSKKSTTTQVSTPLTQDSPSRNSFIQSFVCRGAARSFRAYPNAATGPATYCGEANTLNSWAETTSNRTADLGTIATPSAPQRERKSVHISSGCFRSSPSNYHVRTSSQPRHGKAGTLRIQGRD
jgi:hypothetical protein